MRSIRNLTLKLSLCSSVLLGLPGLAAAQAPAPAQSCRALPGAAQALLSARLNGQDQGDIFVLIGTGASSFWLPRGSLERWGLDLGTLDLGCLPGEPDALYERVPVGAELSAKYETEASELQIIAPAQAFKLHRIDLLSSAQDESQPVVATSLRYAVSAAYDRSLSGLASVSLLHLNSTNAFGAGVSGGYSARGFSVASPQLWYSQLFAGGSRLRLGTADPANVNVGGDFAGVSYFSPDPGSTLPSVSGSTVVPAHYVVSILGYPVAVGDLPPGPFVLSHLPVPEGRGLLTTTLTVPQEPGKVLSTQTQPYLYFESLLKPGTVRYEVHAGYQNVLSASRALLGVADLSWGVTPSLSSHFRIDGGPSEQRAAAGLILAEPNYGGSVQVQVNRVGERYGLFTQARLDLQSALSPWQVGASAQYSQGALFGSTAGLVLGGNLSWQRRPVALGVGVGWALGQPSPWTFRASADYQFSRNLTLNTSVIQREGHATIQVVLLSTFKAPEFLTGVTERTGIRPQGGAALSVSALTGAPLSSLQPAAQLDLPVRGVHVQVNAGRQGGSVSAGYGVLYPVTASVGLSNGFTSLNGSLSVTGALAYVDGVLLPLAPNAGNVGEVLLGYPGVRVYVNGNVVGRSDARGVVLLSGLLASSLNEVSLAVEDLPPEITVDRERAKVYVAVFDARKVDFRPFLHRGTLLTLTHGGVPIAETARVSSAGQVVSVGSKGQIYLYDASEGQVIQVRTDEFSCTAAFRAQDVLECQEGNHP